MKGPPNNQQQTHLGGSSLFTHKNSTDRGVVLTANQSVVNSTLKPQSLAQKFALSGSSGSNSMQNLKEKVDFAGHVFAVPSLMQSLEQPTAAPTHHKSQKENVQHQKHPNFFFGKFTSGPNQPPPAPSTRPKTSMPIGLGSAAGSEKISEIQQRQKDKYKGVATGDAQRGVMVRQRERHNSIYQSHTEGSINQNTVTNDLINICITQQSKGSQGGNKQKKAAANMHQFHTLSKSPRLLGSPRTRISPKNSNEGSNTSQVTAIKGASGSEYFQQQMNVKLVQPTQSITIQPYQGSNQGLHSRAQTTLQADPLRLSLNQAYKKVQAQQQKTQQPHKKSQSLYKKKIVDIIQGLQQSLAVIASQVKTSMNSSTEDKALLESALLAQKLALLTQNLNNTTTQQSTQRTKGTPLEGIKPQSDEKRMSKKRGSSQKGRKVGRKNEMLNEMVDKRQYYKTIEDEEAVVSLTRESQIAKDYKVFMDAPHSQNLKQPTHQRTKSDTQINRSSLAQICASSLSKQGAAHNISQNYYHSVPHNHAASTTAVFDLHNLINTSDTSSRVNPHLVSTSLVMDSEAQPAHTNALKIVQQIQSKLRRAGRPQSASMIGSSQKSMPNQTSTSRGPKRLKVKASGGSTSIHKRLNQMPSAIFKPSIAQHKKSTSDAVDIIHALFSTQGSIGKEVPTFQEAQIVEGSKVINALTAINTSKEIQSKRGSQTGTQETVNIVSSQSMVNVTQGQLKAHLQKPSPRTQSSQRSSQVIPAGIAQLAHHSQFQNQRQSLLKSKTHQQSTTTIPTPCITVKHINAVQTASQPPQTISKQSIKLVGVSAAVTRALGSSQMSQKKQLTIKALKDNEEQMRKFALQQQQHKRINSEGKVLKFLGMQNSTKTLVQRVKEMSQSRERSTSEGHASLGQSVVLLNLKGGKQQHFGHQSVSPNRQSVQSINPLRQTQTTVNQQNGLATARSDAFSSQYNDLNAQDLAHNENLMSNETTLKKKPIYTHNRGQSSIVHPQLSVDAPQFNHYITKSSNQHGSSVEIYDEDTMRSEFQKIYKGVEECHYQTYISSQLSNHQHQQVYGPGGKKTKESVMRNQTSLGGQQRTTSTDKKLFLTDEALFPGAGGAAFPIQQSSEFQPKSPLLNIMPTPKAIQPLSSSVAGLIGNTTIDSAVQSQRATTTVIEDSSIQNTCIKNPRVNSIVVVPNTQAVSGGFLKPGAQQKVSQIVQQHKRQQTAALLKEEAPSTNQSVPQQTINTCESLRGNEGFDPNTSQTGSPRSKEKRRICKMIKLAFSGPSSLSPSNPPIKTNAEYYRIGKMLGKGAFGRVNLAMHKITEHLVAVKSMNKQFLTQEGAASTGNNVLLEGKNEELLNEEKKKLLQELLILQKVATRHRNIVRLFDSFETARHLVFVMELCAGGDILTYVRKRGCLSEDVARELFSQAAAAVHYCHRKGIVHRDIKLDNMLLDVGNSGSKNGKGNVTLKLCDFGVSKLLTDPENDIMTEQCGTPAYIAPEILLGCQPSGGGYKGFTPDVWSLGVCLYAMLFGTVPFKANNMSDLHQMIVKAKYSMKKKSRSEELSKDLKSLLKGLLEPDSTKRLTMNQVRKHPWLQIRPLNKVEIFSEEELQVIKKDFTYKEMVAPSQKSKSTSRIGEHPSRLHHNSIISQSRQTGPNPHMMTDNQNSLPLFTEHELDEECGGGGGLHDSKIPGGEPALRNCSAKSLVLAPFNSTWSDKRMQEAHQGLDFALIVDKKVIKYANRVKDLNRQYEMNNNCDLDNGVYNKFVNQSSSEEEDADDEPPSDVDSENECGSRGVISQKVHMFDSEGCYADGDIPDDDEQNSLVTSMNQDMSKVACRRITGVPQAPLVSQMSDNEDEELERIIRQPQVEVGGELQQLQTFLQRQTNTFFATAQEDEDFQVDYELVERIEQTIGYPRNFITESIEGHEMNDAATCYYLLDKDRMQMILSDRTMGRCADFDCSGKVLQ